jgi:hypothetical protein
MTRAARHSNTHGKSMKPAPADPCRPFYGFNTLPKHPGNENMPPAATMAKPARRGVYKAKCQPEILEIIARARRMRKNHPLLKSAYLVTDAPGKWVEEVRMWLLSEGWERVWIGRRDMWGGRAEREVGQGVELEVARRAGVYVGNGVSDYLGVQWLLLTPVLALFEQYSLDQAERRHTSRSYTVLVISNVS